jgi:hypothetical protein
LRFVRRRADVHARGGRLVERRDLARFEEAEQLRLEVEAELADLIEEQRAVAGASDDAEIIVIRPGECAAAMAEQLALEEMRWYGRAVEWHERFGCAVGAIVNRPGEDLLARTALAGNQHGDVRADDALCERHRFAHVAGHDRISLVEREFLSRPQRLAAVPLGAARVEFVETFNERTDGVQRRNRFDVVPSDEGHFIFWSSDT